MILRAFVNPVEIILQEYLAGLTHSCKSILLDLLILARKDPFLGFQCGIKIAKYPTKSKENNLSLQELFNFNSLLNDEKWIFVWTINDHYASLFLVTA